MDNKFPYAYIQYILSLKIWGFIKVGGHFLLYSTIRNKEGLGYYHVGTTRFVDLCLPLQFVLSTLEESGLRVIEHTLLPEKGSIELQNMETADADTTTFITAVRSK